VARDVAHFRTIEAKQYAVQVGSYKLTVSELLSVAGASNEAITLKHHRSISETDRIEL